MNPKNVEELEVERGGYSSEYGDRTYGLFNVVRHLLDTGNTFGRTHYINPRQIYGEVQLWFHN